MPYYANIRSKDAPIHFGSTPRLAQTDPTIYTIGGLENLNLKKISMIDSKRYALNQKRYELDYDGFEISNGEVVIFPSSIPKLKIELKDNIQQFIQKNEDVDFREWTTDK